jgi:hypothetical protein
MLASTFASSSNHQVRTIASLLIFLATAAIAFAQQAPPVLNKPYRCASNGHTFTILNCNPWKTDQMCTYREDDQNGRQVNAATSLWTQMAGRMAGCTLVDNSKPAAASSPQTASPPQIKSGALNPAYLNQFPSVDQVMSQLKGTDAQDTTNLELGTLRQLPQFIEDLAGQRWIHNQMTPDESRLIGAYTLAYNNLAKPLNYPFDNYFNQPALLTKLASTFSMSQAISQWEGGNQKAAVASAANLPPAPKPASTSKSAGANGVSASAGVRRCVELGGDPAACQIGAPGTLLGMLSSSWTTPTPGLRLTGSYKSPSGLTLDFNDDAVVISGCSQMVAANHNYKIQPNGTQFAITVDNPPQSFLVALGSDGEVVGPASVTISGQVITGYNDGVAGMKNTATNTPVPGTVRVVHDPIYAAKTATCAAGAMSPGLIDPPSGDAFNDVAMMMFPDTQTAQQREAPGARMLGTFAGAGGLKIEFQSTGAVIDCAQAHVATQYSVASTPSGVTITLKNGSSPFSLMLQPNVTLSGTGSAKIDGRLVSGQNGSSFTFTPISASCAIGTLAVTK